MRVLLIGWGIVSAVGVTCLVGVVSYNLLFASSGSLDVTSSACKRQAHVILNWCQLGSGRMEGVLHAHESKRSFTGDHVDMYAIRISHMDVSELKTDMNGYGWTQCDQAEGVLKDAIDFAGDWGEFEKTTWFPEKQDMKSPDMFVFSWRIAYSGTRPTAVQLMFVRPSDKTVFYISAKT